MVLMEASSRVLKKDNKYQKKYKCRYCNNMYTRQRLPNHIQDVHESEIPEGYTALRLAFNIINKKEYGTCIIDKAVTAWNENKGRYERLCGKESCHNAYVKIVKERMKKKYGTENMLQDERYADEQQKKMLANRKISGTYTFSDGGKIGYTGEYERKTLEFMDKIMFINSEDIESPGPILDYEYNGKTHRYISDFYYIPYNLVIEVKDGGSNPNNRVMQEYREKQIAKEDMIKKINKYNYIRLTDNNFAQLIEIMALLKYNLDEDEMIIKINESMAGTIAGALPSSNSTFIIKNNLQNNVFSYGVTQDPTQDEFLIIDEECKVKKISKNDLPKDSYEVFKVKSQDDAEDIWFEALMLFNTKTNIPDRNYFYTLLGSNKPIYENTKVFKVKNFDTVISEMSDIIYDELTDGGLIHGIY